MRPRTLNTNFRLAVIWRRLFMYDKSDCSAKWWINVDNYHLSNWVSVQNALRQWNFYQFQVNNMCQLKAPARSFRHNLITRLFAINGDLAEKLICSYCRKYLYQKKDKYLGASAEIFEARVFPRCPLFLSICGNSRCRLFWWCVRSVPT